MMLIIIPPIFQGFGKRYVRSRCICSSRIDPKHGYRICVGRFMVNNALFINIATVLWAANISARKDEGGNPILPDTFEAIPGLAMSVSIILSF